MIVIDQFEGKSVGVLGLARSGLSMARALQAGGSHVVGWDDSKEPRDFARDGGIRIAPDISEEWEDVAALLVSPGIPLSHPLAQRANAAKIPILGDMDLFQRAVKDFPNVKIVAITGTNGKSTTAALLAQILRCASMKVRLGGNIGRPVLDLDLPRRTSEERIYVLEVSSFQLERAKSFAPHVAVHLNLAPDHIGRHGSMESYARAKARIFAKQGAHDVAILGLGDRYRSAKKLTRLLERRQNPPQIVQIGKGGAFFEKDGVLMDASDPNNPSPLARLNPQTLIGKHNVQNAAAAAAAALALGGGADAIERALETFQGLPHRLEALRRIEQVRFINDSKATNPEAAAHALASYDSIYWIAGGEGKNLSLDPLKPYLPKIKHAYLLGESADEIARFLGTLCKWTKVKDLKEATEKALIDASAAAYAVGSRPSGISSDWKRSAPVVLLSPAAASFDMFSDFEARGDAFREEVRALSPTHPIKRTFLLAAGGTGGHLFPAEALARELTERGHECDLLTDRRALRWAHPRIWKNLYKVPAAPFAGKNLLRILWAVGVLIAGFLVSFNLLRKKRPDMVVGFGGYAALAPLLAARMMQLPTSIHEQGAHWGRANRFLARFAHVISCAFLPSPLMQERYRHKIFTTGLLQRRPFLLLKDENYAPPQADERFHLLVIGGSQAARIFNRILPAALRHLPKHLRARVHITQQCPEADIDDMTQVFERLNIVAEIQSFFKDIPQRMAQSHLIMARAGRIHDRRDRAHRTPFHSDADPRGRGRRAGCQCAIPL